jgi:hypothetical protein
MRITLLESPAMIRLTIKHSFVEETTGIHPHATYCLRDHEDPHFRPAVLEARLANKRLSELAKMWFLLNRKGNEPDANEELLADYPRADTTLADLLALPKPGFFSFTCDDPIVVAALDERVRRACAMILENEVCETYLRTTQEEFFPLNDSQATPSGRALPVIRPDIRKKATERT